MKPRRIQRKRTKGWRMPKNTIYVGRPTKWSNPFRVDEVGDTQAQAVNLYLHFIGHVTWLPSYADIKRELRGKNLACFCKLSEPCHADVLLKIANRSCRSENHC